MLWTRHLSWRNLLLQFIDFLNELREPRLRRATCRSLLPVSLSHHL